MGGKIDFFLPVSKEIGLGHLVRCRTLAQKLSSKEIKFWIASDWSYVEIKSVLGAFEFEFLYPGRAPFAEADCVVVDFPVPERWLLSALKNADVRVLLGCSDEAISWATLVVNVAENGLRARRKGVLKGSGTTVLSGAGYAILREEFFASRKQIGERLAMPVLVAMGGTDAANLSLQIAERLSRQSARPIRVILPSTDMLSRGNMPDNVTLLGFIERIHEEIDSAGLLVTAPGTLLLEALAMRVPAIAIPQNRRQRVDFEGFPYLVDHDLCDLQEMVLSLEDERAMLQWKTYADSLAVGSRIHEILDHLECPECA
jgi:spore coat polysaccharide biosynthesis predicted glycosyltransferase SpsG